MMRRRRGFGFGRGGRRVSWSGEGRVMGDGVYICEICIMDKMQIIPGLALSSETYLQLHSIPPLNSTLFKFNAKCINFLS